MECLVKPCTCCICMSAGYSVEIGYVLLEPKHFGLRKLEKVRCAIGIQSTILMIGHMSEQFLFDWS